MDSLRRGSLPKLTNFTRKSPLKIPRTIRQHFSWVALHCFSNRLDDAQKWLEKAIVLQPDDADAKVMLAQVFYRRDDFQKAAASLKGVDVSSNKLVTQQYPTLNVAKLESFKGQTPYELHGNGTST